MRLRADLALRLFRLANDEPIDPPSAEVMTQLMCYRL